MQAHWNLVFLALRALLRRLPPCITEANRFHPAVPFPRLQLLSDSRIRALEIRGTERPKLLGKFSHFISKFRILSCDGQDILNGSGFKS
jgi:hypothetical protein